MSIKEWAARRGMKTEEKPKEAWGGPRADAGGAARVEAYEADRRQAVRKGKEAKAKGTPEAHAAARKAHEVAAKSGAAISNLHAEHHREKAAAYGQKASAAQGAAPAAPDTHYRSLYGGRGQSYGELAQAAREATDRAEVAGTSEKAWRESAAAHREAGGSTMNKSQEREHLAKAKEHDRIADDYKRDEQGRFASK